ncbi:acetyltransferase (GNAT) family protein [Flavobacteriaceae bacterium MAR_2010_72]|nr:acetyltransferase (GNAT) family protein [Flavobacteriaceae bacterium MAR_2010_72]
MSIIEAHISHIQDLAPLFNAYRLFYKQPSDLEGAKQFLKERLQNKESVIYLAYMDKKTVGFTQLYPLFSSVSMKPMYLLNDLYVTAEYRGHGIGEALINKAKSLCSEKNYKGLALQTANDNPAQKLYERLGFIKDSDLYYNWTL